MIIAIYGPSGTGKTAISGLLAEMLGLPFRLCGEAVKGRAAMLGVPWRELPDEQHRAVDAETRIWVNRNQPCLVEGRYLDYVLVPSKLM
jgi:cytidylate kinase